MEVAPQANGPDFTTREKQINGWDGDNEEIMPKSDLTAEEQSLLNSFRKDSVDDHWNADEPDSVERAPSRQSTEEIDYDDYGYTDDQRQALLELDNMRLDLGYTEEDPPEYDVAERVRQLNEELANEPPPDEDRRRSIKFKENLVDLVAPPPDYDEDESDGNSSTPGEGKLEQNRAAPDGEEQSPTVVEAIAGGDNQRSNSPGGTDQRSNSPSERSDSPSEINQRSNSPSEANQRSNSPSETNKRSNSPSEANQRSNSPSETNKRSNSPSETIQRGNSPSETNQRSNSPSETNRRSNSPRETNQRGNSPIETNQRGNSPSETNQRGNSPSETNQRGNSPSGTKIPSPEPQGSGDGPVDKPVIDNGNGDTEVRTSLDNGYSSGDDAEDDYEYEEDFEEPDTPTPTPPTNTSSGGKKLNSPRSNSNTKTKIRNKNKKTKNNKTSAAMSSKTSPTKKDDEEKVLIERDGKFELMSVAELKAQGLYPMAELADEVVDSNANSKKSGKDDDEKVLVERNGKFEMVSKAELRAQGLLLDEDDDVPEELNKRSSKQTSFAPKPPAKPRPATAAQARHHTKPVDRRSQSARYGMRSEPGVIDNFTYTSPYALTAEEKAEMRRQKRREMDDEKKQKEVNEKEEDQRRRMNNDCFQFWLEQKKKEAQRRHKEERHQKEEKREEDKQKPSKQSHDGSTSSLNSQEDDVNSVSTISMDSNSQHSQACESAFEEWLKTKRKQRQRDEYVDKQRMKEERSHWDVRPRQECDKAFKQWVKKKRKDARQEQNEARSKQRINKLMVRRTRKAMALARALRQSQSFRYVDYYGYRF